MSEDMLTETGARGNDITISASDFLLENSQRFQYHQAPWLIYWELTRACELACKHCRADAIKYRHPHELNTVASKQLLTDIAGFSGSGGGAGDHKRSSPHIVLTGGDPLLRPDLFELISYAKTLLIPMSITPAGTPRANIKTLAALKAAGIESIGLSLDGSSSAKHDWLRGVKGSFYYTVRTALNARALGLPVQINTMVTRETLPDIPEILRLVKRLDIIRWALFFLIPTGRGRTLAEISPKESERFLTWLSKVAKEAPFQIKTTEAHHYRRIVTRRILASRRSIPPKSPLLLGSETRGFGIRDGNGIVFISHTGKIYPSGFLPLEIGNVKDHSLVDTYRNNPIFKALRESDNLSGKCGVCEYRHICGGSRARAFAHTGDSLASDPLCLYQPNPSKHQLIATTC